VKKAIIIIALLLFLKPVLPVFEYVVNYDYIVKELCENKDKPELHCNGKCHLMKELAKASEDEKPLSEKKSVHHEQEILFCQDLLVWNFTAFKPAFIQQDLMYKNLYNHDTAVSIFHPPAFIS
jgi:hypothetical protein